MQNFQLVKVYAYVQFCLFILQVFLVEAYCEDGIVFGSKCYIFFPLYMIAYYGNAVVIYRCSFKCLLP